MAAFRMFGLRNIANIEDTNFSRQIEESYRVQRK
jgi:hypothetical protein